MMRKPSHWKNPSREDIAWAAGLFEGEGCFTLCGQGRSTIGQARRAQLGMTDEDVVQRFHAIVGVGGISIRVNKPPRKPFTYYWYVSSFESIQHVIALFWPWLHARRREAALKLLEGGEALRAAQQRDMVRSLRQDGGWF